MFYLIAVWSPLHKYYNILDKDKDRDTLSRILKNIERSSASYDDTGDFYRSFDIVDENYIKNNPLSKWSRDYTK